jgi:lipid II:glycine glycyltransferase (peptidoglycan interpeptide bridge formation enzyme)
LTRRTRQEHVLDLEREDVLGGVGSQHRRNISRAVKAGLSIHRTRQASACTQHVELMNASLERRAKRGEEVEISGQRTRLLALLTSRSGEIFQAVHGEKVLSSILILRSSQGAYYQSAGTLPEGMKVGASPFLVSRVATTLKQEGCRVFNLGGATPDNAGLHRFKAGFGTREVALEAASFCPKSVVARNVHTALRTGLAWIKQ